MNWKRGMYAMGCAIGLNVPYQHMAGQFWLMNGFYEWPKNRVEANIYFKEIFRLPNFWGDLRKKLTWGLVAAGGDTAIKLSFWQTVHGGTWSP